MKAGALPQREMVRIKCGGAAAARNGQYKKSGRCGSEKWSELKAGALPQREIVTIKSRGAAAGRTGQYKKSGRCFSEDWSI